jgi:GT2 family glycosyltransferase
MTGPAGTCETALTVVVVTRDRRQQVLDTVERLVGLPERPGVIVVDNASADGTADAVTAAHSNVRVVRLPRNLGAVARNVGVARARTRYVAFADDDSWWQPGSLARAVDHFDAAPRLGLLATKVLVDDDLLLDPTSALMEASGLPAHPDLPGPAVLGFLACGAVVRRSAFLAVGGFSWLLFFLGEEAQLAYDLAANGWALAYAPDVVAEHHPGGATRLPDGRRRLHERNDLLTTWLRRPLPVVVRQTGLALRKAAADPVTRGAVVDALRRLPDVVARRRRLPAWVEAQLVALDRERPRPA